MSAESDRKYRARRRAASPILRAALKRADARNAKLALSGKLAKTR